MSSSADPAGGAGAAAAYDRGLASILLEVAPHHPHIAPRVHSLVSDQALKAMLGQSLLQDGAESDSDDVPPPFLQHNGQPFGVDDADTGGADTGLLGSVSTCAWVRLILNSVERRVTRLQRCHHYEEQASQQAHVHPS